MIPIPAWILLESGSGSGSGVSLFRVWLSDPHSNSNTIANGGTGTVNPLQTAYLSLPSSDRAKVLYVLFGGDSWNDPNSGSTYQTAVKNELAAAGITDKVFGLAGNHDDQDFGNDPFTKIYDPLGTNSATSGRNSSNFPAQPNGNARCYSLKFGNLYNILIGDNQNFGELQGENAGLPPGKLYNASGGYSDTDWRLAVYKFLSNLDCNIIWSTHHPLKDTTAGSGFLEAITAGLAWLDPTNSNLLVDYEAFRGSYLAFYNGGASERRFTDFFNSVYGFALCYEHGHLHIGIDEVINGRSWYENKFGIQFINKACVNDKMYNSSFRSFVTYNLKFEEISGNNYKIKTYVVSDGIRSPGYQADLEKNIPLKFPFSRNYVSTNPSSPASPTINSIDVSVKGCATLNIDKANADGILVIRKLGSAPTFTPTSNTAYLREDAAGDGIVAFMGTNTSFQDYGITGGTWYYKVYAFNGRNEKISFSSPASSNATIVTADSAKIISEMGLDGGSCICYLDARLGITTVSGKVSNWADQTSNALDASQSTAGNRPTYDSVNKRITFVAASSTTLSIAYNALHYFGYAPQATWLFDVPFGIFAKVRMTDSTKFRILTKVSGTNAEFICVTNTSDKPFFGIYTDTTSNNKTINSATALTSYEGKDLFVFINYYGGGRFEYNGAQIFVYDKNATLIANQDVSTAASVGTYQKIKDKTLPMTIGGELLTTPDYADGQINGLVVKRGKIFTQQEITYLMDNFKFSDDL